MDIISDGCNEQELQERNFTKWFYFCMADATSTLYISILDSNGRYERVPGLLQ